MENLISRYLAKFDEINIIADGFDETTTEEEAQEIIRDIMIDGYLEGFAAVGYELNDRLDRMYETSSLVNALNAVVDDKTASERITEHVQKNALSALRNVTETEFHRMYILGGNDRARAIDRERPIEKLWRTVRDGSVRETHKYLEGISLPFDGEFYTFDGDHALAPGLFGRVENNAHCRCILSYRYI